LVYRSTLVERFTAGGCVGGAAAGARAVVIRMALRRRETCGELSA
jgi:hypothetical protein